MQLTYLFLFLLLVFSSSYAQKPTTPAEKASAELARITAENIEAKKRLARADSMEKSIAKQMSPSQNSQIKRLRNQIAYLRKEITKKIQELAAKETGTMLREETIRKLGGITKTLEQKIKELEKEISDLGERNSELETEINEAKKQIEEAEQKINALYTEIDQKLAFEIIASTEVYQKGKVFKKKTPLSVELKENEKQEIRYASLQEVRIETSPLFNKLGKPLKYDLKYSDNGQEKSVIEGKKLMPGEQEISILQNKNFDFKKFRKKVFTLTVYYEENLQPNKIYITRTFSWD